MLYDDEDDYNSRHEMRMLTDEDRVTLYYGDEFDDEGDFIHSQIDYNEQEPERDYEFEAEKGRVHIRWEATTKGTFKDLIDCLNEIKREIGDSQISPIERNMLHEAFIASNIKATSTNEPLEIPHDDIPFGN